MGFVVTSKDGQPIQPVFNSSSSRLQELFLQDVMGMSARTYDRRLLSLTLRTGRSRPVSYENVDDLLTRLQRDRHAVAFVWSEDVADADNIKIVRVLWRR